MSTRKDRSIGVRLLSSLSSLALIGCAVYIFIAGFNLVSTLILVSALGGLTGPAVVAADGLLDCVTGIFELFVEGVLSVFEFIGNLFGSFFS